MIVGKTYEFTIVSHAQDGHYIRPADDDVANYDDIFLPFLKSDPARSQSLEVGQKIDAFLYQNDDGQLTASLLIPYAEVNEFAVLDVVNTQNFGAFLDWGLEKDLFVSEKKQKNPMRIGQRHLVRICYDADSGKLYGTSKFGSLMEGLDIYLEENDKAQIIPVEEHELGYRCIVNKEFLGMIYHSEIFTDIDLEKEYDGYVKKIREDGLLDLSLQRQGVKKLNDSQSVVLDFLKDNGGKSHLNDKSSPEEIKNLLGMSKKSFKSAIGMLYKAKKIIISKNGIELTSK